MAIRLTWNRDRTMNFSWKSKFVAWIKLHLVDDARDVWKWYSTWAAVTSGAVSLGWAAVPQDIKDGAAWWVPLVVSAICFAGPALRVLRQGKSNVS